MSAVCVLAPVIIAGWPAISAAVAGAATALGISVVHEGVASAAQASVASGQATTVELTVKDSEILGESLATEQQVVLRKGDVTLRVARDARGQCQVSIQGTGRSHEELRAMGDEFVRKLTQMYVYNKVMSELRNKGFTVISEQVGEDQAVHIQVRQQVA